MTDLVCPECCSTLSPKAEKSVLVHVCPQRHGAWLSKETADAAGLRRQSGPPRWPTGERKPVGEDKRKLSPAIPNLLMVVIAYEDVEIDYCPISGGIWLDAHEVVLLIDILLAAKKQRDENAKENRAIAFDVGGDLLWLVLEVIADVLLD